MLIDPASLPKVDTIMDKLQRQKEAEAASFPRAPRIVEFGVRLLDQMSLGHALTSISTTAQRLPESRLEMIESGAQGSTAAYLLPVQV